MTEHDRYLLADIAFPHGVYSGGDRGEPEAFPTPARLFDALTAAAGGGPDAATDGDILVAAPAHQEALEWLEQQEVVRILAPEHRVVRRSAQRFRRRASPVTLAQTPFEPFSALGGEVTLAWPAPDSAGVVTALQQIAAEVEYIGRVESIAIVRFRIGGLPDDPRVHLAPQPGRGAGLVMTVPQPGRHGALVRTHRDRHGRGTHATGPLGKQAPDEQPSSCTSALALRRFAHPGAEDAWPFREVWWCAIEEPEGHAGRVARTLDDVGNHVPLAVAWHRAIVRDLAADVPSFVTGRDGDGPLRDAGHLALHFAVTGTRPHAVLAIPRAVDPADRARLWSLLTGGVDVHWGRGRRAMRFRVRSPRSTPGSNSWDQGRALWRTHVPLVLDATGSPRRGGWSLEDAVIHSVANAFRGPLEAKGLEWGTGWRFRRRVVDELRDAYGVKVIDAHRRSDRASRFVHRAADHELVVAVDAHLTLGTLVSAHEAGFVALGRARHLGGGLLLPEGDA